MNAGKGLVFIVPKPRNFFSDVGIVLRVGRLR